VNWIYKFFDFHTTSGINRVAYSEDNMRFNAMMIKKMQELGMDVTYDNILNICGTIGKGEKVIALHSHSDSVPNGGQFDGMAGLVASLMAIEQMNKLPGVTFKVIINACEESSRFDQSCLGSKYLAGKIKSGDFQKINKDGDDLKSAVNYGESMLWKWLKQFECKPITKTNHVIGKGEVDYAVEPHIEQSDFLHRQGKDIGVVKSIAAPYRFRLKFQGDEYHTGSTPMDERRDASVAAAKFTLSMYEQAGLAGSFLSATISNGTQSVSMNKSAPEVLMKHDIRMLNPWTPEKMSNFVREMIATIERDTGVKIEKNVLSTGTPRDVQGEVYKKLIRASKNAGFKTEEGMVSGAGHDAAYIPAKDSGLFFIPNTGGSHNPKEMIEKKSLFNAAVVIKNFATEAVKLT